MCKEIARSNWESWHYKDCLLNALRKLDNGQASALDSEKMDEPGATCFEIKEMKAQEIADAADISQRSPRLKDEKSKQEHWAEIQKGYLRTSYPVWI